MSSKVVFDVIVIHSKWWTGWATLLHCIRH